MRPDPAISRAQFPLRIPGDLRAALDAYAAGYGISVNEAILRLLDRALAYEIVYARGLDAINIGGIHGGTDEEPDQAPERPEQHAPAAA